MQFSQPVLVESNLAQVPNNQPLRRVVRNLINALPQGNEIFFIAGPVLWEWYVEVETRSRSVTNFIFRPSEIYSQ